MAIKCNVDKSSIAEELKYKIDGVDIEIVLDDEIDEDTSEDDEEEEE